MSDTFKFPAIRGYQGQITTYQIQVTASQIITLLGHDPRSRGMKKRDEDIIELYGNAQRSTHPSRIDKLTQYLSERVLAKNIIPGALPSISVGFVAPLSFALIKSAPDNVGILTLPRATLLRVVFDGRGRFSTLLDMYEAGTRGVDGISVPVTIYSPRKGKYNSAEFGQLFFDFNKTGSRVTAAQARGKDIASAHSQLARRIMALPALAGIKDHAHAFTEEKMIRFIRCAVENIPVGDATRSIKSPILDHSNISFFKNAFDIFWSEFARLTDSSVWDHTVSVLSIQQSYGALAVALFKLKYGRLQDASEAELKKFAAAAASINWLKSNKEWVGILYGDFGGVLKVGGGGAGTAVNDFVWDKISRYLATH